MRLYHALPSYYSAIARLALVEAGIAFASTIVDIHRRAEQTAPDYARKNPHLTVPTLEKDDGTLLTESRDILELALPAAREPAAKGWIDRHYAFPVEELTMGNLITKNPLARRVFPRRIAATETRLRAMAEANPDLRDVYLARAEVFAERRRTFDPAATAELFRTRLAEAEALLDRLEAQLGDGRACLLGDHGAADVVWTVFLARVHFIGRADVIAKRPHVAAYDERMAARPSFAKGEVWRRMKILKMLQQVF